MAEPIILKDTAGNEIYRSSTARTVKEAVEELADKTPYNQYIENLDLRGADLKGLNLAFIHTLKDADFSGADLTGANLEGVNLGADAKFDNSRLVNVNIRGAIFNASLNGATIDNVAFDKYSYVPGQLKGIPVEIQERLSKQQVAQQESPQMDKEQEDNHLEEAQVAQEDLEDRNEELIKSRSAMDSMIMQSSTRPTEAQIEVSKQADIDVDATYAQVDGGTVPSEVLIQANNIKGFETLKPSHQIILKTAIKIANKTLSSIDADLRTDIKRNFETNYEKAIANGSFHVPPEIEQYVEQKMQRDKPVVHQEPQKVKERDYKEPEKELVM